MIDVHDERPSTESRRRPRGLPAPVVVGAAWLAGSVPFSNIVARRRAEIDLRAVGTGTVSGTALYEVAGFGPLAVAGVFDVAKGVVGPLLAGRDRPVLGAVAATAGVAGHNWSPWLRGAGGRGLSVAFGAFLPLAWPGTVVLALGLAGGRLRRQTGLGTFLGAALVVPVVARTHGRAGAVAGAGIVGALLAKRMAGNQPPARRTAAVYLHRLVFDHDPPGAAAFVSERSERTMSAMRGSAHVSERSERTMSTVPSHSAHVSERSERTMSTVPSRSARRADRSSRASRRVRQ